MKRWGYLGLAAGLFLACTMTFSPSRAAEPSEAAESSCVECHETLSPGQVADWRVSRHHAEEIGCGECHGIEHDSSENAHLAVLPDERLCADCHEEQFEQFTRGKHNLG